MDEAEFRLRQRDLFPAPAKVLTPLWRHQEEMVRFARERGAVLWDAGMGTGKTLAALALIAESPSTLVLCPNAVQDVWVTQVGRHASGLSVVNPRKGTVKNRADEVSKGLQLAAIRRTPVVVVVNYDSAWRPGMADLLMRVPWSLIVADEVHRLKSPGSKVSWFAKGLGKRHAGARRLGLSGTPLPQGPLDAYGTYRFLDSSIFGANFSLFKARYAEIDPRFPGQGRVATDRQGRPQYRNLDEFAQRYGSLRFHVSRDVLDLPETVDTERPFRLSPTGLKAYRGMHKDMLATLESGAEISAANVLAKTLRLQQITSGYLPTETGNEVVDTGKFEQLVEILDELPQDEPVVVFCRFHEDLERVYQANAETGRPMCCEISGRRKNLQEWQDGKSPVLAAQISSGSEGIDLTRAAHTVFYSVGYSLAEYLQARARTHRPGQERTCFYHHIVAKGTVDELIYQALRNKQDVVRAITEQARQYGGTASVDDPD